MKVGSGRLISGATFWGAGASKQAVTGLADIRVAEELLARARSGDDAAQAAIYGVMAPATYALIRRLVGGRAIAEDLFQDTMMAVFERLTAFRNEAPLGAWVRRIAVTKCLMYLRSPWHRARLRLLDDSEQDEPYRTEYPYLQIASAPSAESFDVERALASLTPTSRAVVWLYEVEGFSHEEIARSFGKSVSFSKSQLARAHQRLREWFEPDAARRPVAPA
jgi:RNA polymerase sigma-70 factor (ECF subfamily)